MLVDLTRSQNHLILPAFDEGLFYGSELEFYTQPHLCHTRSYVSTSLLRRILRDCLNFDTYFVNIIANVIYSRAG